MTFRRLAAASVIGSAALLAGCGGDDLARQGNRDSTLNVVGSYDLRSIYGDDLPFTIIQSPDGSRIREITASNLLIRADGNFVLDATFRTTTDGQSETFSDVLTGSWFLSGSRITLDYDTLGACTDTGTVSGNRITIEADCALGWHLVYEK